MTEAGAMIRRDGSCAPVGDIRSEKRFARLPLAQLRDSVRAMQKQRLDAITPWPEALNALLRSSPLSIFDRRVLTGAMPHFSLQ